LFDRMDQELAWDQTLSGGEKQRLGFARLLVHRPDIVVLDEATSALDPPGQEQVMRLIATSLPGATVISVGHRPELEVFHQRKLVMKPHPRGARVVCDIMLKSNQRPSTSAGQQQLRPTGTRVALQPRLSETALPNERLAVPGTA
jgi:vitamin B12/bleomycin/antimicrobial peptide transport system ATP-binding/permease protein